MSTEPVSQDLFLFHMDQLTDTLRVLTGTVREQNSRVSKAETAIAVLQEQTSVAKDSKARWTGVVALLIGLVQTAIHAFTGVGK